MNTPFSPPSLYRQYFTPAECAMLDATPPDDLTSEINLLRVLLARLLAAAQRTRQLSLDLHAKMLSAFSAAGIVIAALVRLQCLLHDPNDAVWAEIERGRNIGRQRRHVFDYFSPPASA